MKQKIFHSTLLVAAAVLCASFLIIMSCLYSYFQGIEEAQLADELSLAMAGVEDSGEDYLRDLDYSRCRLTWISPEGDVLFDSEADEDTMKNHADRQEIRDAFRKGEGADARLSSTIMEKTLYYARKMADGTGLGLSIVKHAAACHQAKLSVDSVPNEGTRITVLFPPA